MRITSMGIIHILRGRLRRLIGIDSNDLQAIAETTYVSTEKFPINYWVYLIIIISAGIAYFGLVMNSTAVVIGAMLVSPLMTPLVQVGMAFAMGNLYLAVKSMIKFLMSIVFVVLLAALTT
jgi:uncharacterized membrane protein